jgi:hypothetical protein
MTPDHERTAQMWVDHGLGLAELELVMPSCSRRELIEWMQRKCRPTTVPVRNDEAVAA